MAARFGHAGVALLDEQPSGLEIDCSFRSQRFAEKFTALIEPPRKNQVGLLAHEHGSLQVAHVEKEKGLVLESFGKGKSKRGEGTNGRKLKHIGGVFRFGHRFGNLFYLGTKQPSDEITSL